MSGGNPVGRGAVPPVILVVDDHDSVRDALGLELAGYRVVAVPDGAAALEVLRAGFVPRVIVLDLMMPLMDGFEFRVRQLADPTLASIPVIIVSADGRATRLAESPGVHAVFVKPVDFDDLVRAIECVATR